MTMRRTRHKLEPQCVHKKSVKEQQQKQRLRRHYEDEGSSMHEDSCIGINYVYAHSHVFPKCFKSLHTLLGFALCLTSSILILVAVTIHSILTCTQIPCGVYPAKTGLLRYCLYWNSGAMGSWQEARHTCVLVECRARLTDLVATVIKATVCSRHCGLPKTKDQRPKTKDKDLKQNVRVSMQWQPCAR